MSTSKGRERDAMMASMTSLSIEVMGAWLELALVGNGNLEYNVEVLAGIVLVGDAAIFEAVGLDFDVILMSSMLFFEKGCDDARGGVDTGR